MNNLIAIASGKGGVGKTWLAITLAQSIARSGRRVLLFDGDIGLANVDVQLGLTPPRDLGSVIQGKCTLAEVVIHHDAGFDIIAGRSGTASLASLPVNALERVGEQLIELGKDYDFILLDLGAGVEQHVQTLATLAARCIVVITDEPTSLTDAYAFIKLTQQRPHPPEFQIVVNMAATQKEGDATYKALTRACMNFLSIHPALLGVIRRDNKVKDSIRSQTPLITRAPHTTAATDVAAIAVKLMQR